MKKYIIPFLIIISGCTRVEVSPPISYYFKAKIYNSSKVNLTFNETTKTISGSSFNKPSPNINPDKINLVYQIQFVDTERYFIDYIIEFHLLESSNIIDNSTKDYFTDEQFLEKLNHKKWDYNFLQTSGYERGVIVKYVFNDLKTTRKVYNNYKNKDGILTDDFNNKNYNFNITEIRKKTDQKYGEGLVVIGSFNCVLYNEEDRLDSLIITNSDFKGFIKRNFK